MTDWDTLDATINGADADPATLLGAAEAVIENWIEAKGEAPTMEEREGFRLLALHRQGCKDEPSFNAARETCREIAYHYNLLKPGGPEEGSAKHRMMMGLIANHLLLFVRGKMEVAGLGEFCCASRPIRSMDSITQASETRG
jgi:hypothetical protein